MRNSLPFAWRPVAIVVALFVVTTDARSADRAPVVSDPVADRSAFQAYFRNRFPDVAAADFANGPYAIDAGMRRQWEEIMQFPPFAPAVDEGKELFDKPFAGRSRLRRLLR